MKFFHLPIGAQFEYRGESYRKSGPLVATREGDGRQQLMMRSASVKPESSNPGQPPQTESGEHLSADQVKAAFQIFYQACEQLMVESSGAQSGPQQEELRRRLRTHRQRFLEKLQVPRETR